VTVAPAGPYANLHLNPDITMPASHNSVFIGWMPFLLANQQRQSTEGMKALVISSTIIIVLRISKKTTITSTFVYLLFFQDNPGKQAQEKQNHSGKANLDFLQQEIVSGSGISWAICKSAHSPRQMTMPAPHHSVFTGRMPFLPPNQQNQSTEGNFTC